LNQIKDEIKEFSHREGYRRNIIDRDKEISRMNIPVITPPTIGQAIPEEPIQEQTAQQQQFQQAQQQFQQQLEQAHRLSQQQLEQAQRQQLEQAQQQQQPIISKITGLSNEQIAELKELITKYPELKTSVVSNLLSELIKKKQISKTQIEDIRNYFTTQKHDFIPQATPQGFDKSNYQKYEKEVPPLTIQRPFKLAAF